MRWIGDVHGHFRQYKRIIADCPASIQVGDLGIGFRYCGDARDGEFMANPPYDAMVAGNHRFIKGNHDNPSACRKHTQCIKDGTVEGDIMYIGGALSIDRQWHTEGYDWWPDEELSISELNTLVDVYATAKPRVMVSHDCPETIARLMMAQDGSKIEMPSRTRQALQSMLEIHRPEIWLFGHWHVSLDKVIDGTRFVCLAELEYKDIDV